MIACRGVKFESLSLRCDPECQYTQMITIQTSHRAFAASFPRTVEQISPGQAFQMPLKLR